MNILRTNTSILAIFAWMILPGEKINIYALSGMFIIAGSLVMLTIYKRKNSDKNPDIISKVNSI